MPDYDLTRPGWRAFEQMVVALARKEIGPGVQVFGDGPDGGREATFDGTINWSATSKGLADQRDTWTGYTVLQAKFQVKPGPEPRDNAVRLQGEISSEISKWVTAAREHTRSRLPDYLIFVTNVDLSSVAKSGGIDKVTDFVHTKLAKKETTSSGLVVKDFMIWHADQIRSMLDGNQSVRWAYPGLLTVGDVLSMLDQGVVSLGSLDMQDPLREELLYSLKADRRIRLSESGGPGDGTLWLDDVAIDLPAIGDTPEGATVQAVRHVLEIGDTVLRQRQADRIDRPNLVLVGGPGQGKSTLSQLIGQSYRVAMLTDANLAPKAQEIVTGTQLALERLGIPVPTNRRWPTRVDLPKYAEELASGAETSLLRWISTRLSTRTDQNIRPNSLKEWLRAWPWALILDGLDEVPTLEARRLVYSKIEDLLVKAEDDDADLLIVVTTRPTGYDERLSTERFRHLQLQRLPAAQAVAFAKQITDKRFPDDDEMRVKVGERMLEASRDPVTARLMETPLQVTIMSFIVEKYPTLPPDRFTLFDLYYSTMFEREIAKDIPIARFLSQHRRHINKLHEQVGLALQAASETADGADATMSPQQLHDLTVSRGLFSGFDVAKAETQAAALVQAATTRLVLLVSRDGGIGFDIRTLQEMMAARAISEGDDTQVISRLELIAHHPHWRNTWLLAAGKLLSAERFERKIVDLLKQLDNGPARLNSLYPSAPTLAADILEDNLAADRPRFELGLIQRIFTALDRPAVTDISSLSLALLRIAGSHRKLLFDRIGSAGSAGATRRAAAALALREMSRRTQDNGRHASIRIALLHLDLSETEEHAVAAWEAMLEKQSPPAKALDLTAHLETLVESVGLSSDDLQLLRTGLSALSDSRFVLAGDAPGTVIPAGLRVGTLEPLLQALGNEDIATSLELALEALPSTHWGIEGMLGAAIKPAQNRQPVGHDLLSLLADSESLGDS